MPPKYKKQDLPSQDKIQNHNLKLFGLFLVFIILGKYFNWFPKPPRSNLPRVVALLTAATGFMASQLNRLTAPQLAESSRDVPAQNKPDGYRDPFLLSQSRAPQIGLRPLAHIG